MSKNANRYNGGKVVHVAASGSAKQANHIRRRSQKRFDENDRPLKDGSTKKLEYTFKSHIKR